MCKNARRGICLMQKMCYTNCKLYDSMRKREENSMVTAVRSLGLQGISGYEVTVECFLSGGLPAFDIVGLGDTAVKESRERVRGSEKLRCEVPCLAHHGEPRPRGSEKGGHAL